MPEDYNGQQGYGSYPTQQAGVPSPYGYGGYPDPRGGMDMSQFGYPGQPPMQPKKKLGKGAIIGIVVGVVVIVCGILFALFWPKGDPAADDPSDDPAAVQTQKKGDDDDKQSGGSNKKSGDSDDDQSGSGGVSVPGGASMSGVSIDPNNISDDWTAGEFVIAGQGYRLGESTYGDLVAAGWRLAQSGQEKIAESGGTYILNANSDDWFSFEHASYPGSRLTIGLGNSGNTPINYDQGVITYADCRLPWSDEDVAYDFSVAKGIKAGATREDVISAFGEPLREYLDEDGTYDSLTYGEWGSGTGRLEFDLSPDDNGLMRVTEVYLYYG